MFLLFKTGGGGDFYREIRVKAGFPCYLYLFKRISLYCIILYKINHPCMYLVQA